MKILITTKRLLVRELSISDVDALSATSPSFTPESALAFVEEAIRLRELEIRTTFNLAIEEVLSAKVIGGIEFRIISSFHEVAEIGYWIAKESEGKGYATEATREAAIAFFRSAPINRIQATSAPDNSASHRVLTKAGFTREGRLRQNLKVQGHFRDSELYSLLRDDLADKPQLKCT